MSTPTIHDRLDEALRRLAERNERSLDDTSVETIETALHLAFWALPIATAAEAQRTLARLLEEADMAGMPDHHAYALRSLQTYLTVAAMRERNAPIV